MKHQYFYPPREGDQLKWFINLQGMIVSYYTQLDISTARQAKLQLVLSWLIWTWGTLLPYRRHDAPSAANFRKALIKSATPGTPIAPPEPATLTPPTEPAFEGMLSWLFDEIGRWRTAEGYNDTIGSSLGIIGSVSQGPDYSTIQPIITATLLANTVQIGWTWQGFSGYLDQLEIVVDRGDGKGDVPLAFDTTPGYTDTAPFPATPTKWTYKAIFHFENQEVGLWSASVSAIVGGN